MLCMTFYLNLPGILIYMVVVIFLQQKVFFFFFFFFFFPLVGDVLSPFFLTPNLFQ